MLEEVKKIIIENFDPSIVGYLNDLFNYFIYFIVLFFCSTLIFWTLLLLRQYWIKSLAQTLTLYLLPFITTVITEVISGDIALSLGMIGALSIVRFRNPIRSPFELTIYFLSITLGITVRHDLVLLIFLVISFFALSSLYIFIENILKKKYGKLFFLPSFREGNLVNTLEITTNNDLPSNFNIISPNNIIKHKENDYSFVFISQDRNKILEAYNFFKNHKIVKTINVNLL